MSRSTGNPSWDATTHSLRHSADTILHKLSTRPTIAPSTRHALTDNLEAFLEVRRNGIVDYGWLTVPRHMGDVLRVLREAETRAKSHRERADHYRGHLNWVEADGRIVRYVERLNGVIGEAKKAEGGIWKTILEKRRMGGR
jgi:hypothetical protein